MSWKCACCTKELPDRAIAHIVVTEEGDRVQVGSDCAKNIKDAGTDGYYHEDPSTGPFYSLAAYDEMEAEGGFER